MQAVKRIITEQNAFVMKGNPSPLNFFFLRAGGHNKLNSSRRNQVFFI
jgi:hypothetical protein